MAATAFHRIGGANDHFTFQTDARPNKPICGRVGSRADNGEGEPGGPAKGPS
jgi:hypothetical protein